MIHKTQQSGGRSGRGGFTIIELLIVVSIILILATMTIGVMRGMTNSAREAATATMLLKVNEIVRHRIEAFERGFRGREQDEFAPLRVILRQKGFSLDEGALRILARKRAFRRFFPQQFQDLQRFDAGDWDAKDIIGNGVSNSFGGNGIPDIIENRFGDEIKAKLAGANFFSVHTPETESAELLYFALTEMEVFGAPPADDGAFTSGEIQDTDGDGLLEFVDSWQNPLRFYRWPTRLIDWDPPDFKEPDPDKRRMNIYDLAPQPNNGRDIHDDERKLAGLLIKGLPVKPGLDVSGNPLSRDLLLVDTDDPLGALTLKLHLLNGTAPFPDFASEYNEGNYHTPDTFHQPLLVSAGPDGLLGLFEPSEVDFDLNDDGVVDANEDLGPGPFKGNGQHDGILGNLAQIIFVDENNNQQFDFASDSYDIDPLFDNITNRNRRAGARTQQ